MEKDPSSSTIPNLIDTLVKPPTYRLGKRAKRKLSDQMIEIVKNHLHDNEMKVQSGKRKQQKKAVDIYDDLMLKGFDISYSTIRQLIRELSEKRKEAFIRSDYTEGEICEFDWGQAKLRIGGKDGTFEMAVFTSAFGNYRYARLYYKQKKEDFQDAHAEFFEHIGGTYQTMVYDNMRVAVKSFVGCEKTPTSGLLERSLYYGFTYRFCNFYSGNEKGHVERSVELLRRKAFSMRDSFETLEEANHYLLSICHNMNQKKQVARNGATAIDLLEQEKSHMISPMPKFKASRQEICRVDKYSTIKIEQNRYSVPDHLVEKQVKVVIYSSHIRCYYDGECIADHRRCYGLHQWNLELTHYLTTLKKKPGALATSTALNQAQQQIKNIYQRYFSTSSRDFVELMIWIKEKNLSFHKIEEIIHSLHQIHEQHVTIDKIKISYAKSIEIPIPKDVQTEQAKEIERLAIHHLNAYGALFLTGEREEKGVYES